MTNEELMAILDEANNMTPMDALVGSLQSFSQITHAMGYRSLAIFTCQGHATEMGTKDFHTDVGAVVATPQELAETLFILLETLTTLTAQIPVLNPAHDGVVKLRDLTRNQWNLHKIQRDDCEVVSIHPNDSSVVN